jgi:hypothetical protein
MAKKSNFIRNKDQYKRKMQIEAIKSRDQVNIYGGLGKVGLDHSGTISGEIETEDKTKAEVPSFSSSMMKYVPKTKKTNDY